MVSLLGSAVVSCLVECRTETLEMREGNFGRLKARRDETIEARIWGCPVRATVASRDHVHIPPWCTPFNRPFAKLSTPRECLTVIIMTAINRVIVSITLP
jgi:hypothetical protein